MSIKSLSSTNEFEALSIEERIEQPEAQLVKTHNRHYGNMIPIMIDPAT